ncbi:MAG: proline dehydrogenase family protein [Cyclobacteriaceae bacterium]
MIKERISFDDTSVAFRSKSDKFLKKAYTLFKVMSNPGLVGFGTSLANLALRLKIPFTKSIIKNTVYSLFVGGETLEECESTIDELGASNVKTILDYSVEGEKTEEGFEATKEEMFRIVEVVKTAKHIPFLVIKLTGLGSFDVMKKVQAGEQLSQKEQSSFEALRSRVDQICERVDEIGSKILIDGEESWIQDTIDDITYDMMAKYNRNRVVVYNTYQMYRHDMLENLKVSHSNALENGYQLGAKLVRGAYMERERERAEEMGYPDPMQPDKQATDRDYDLAVKFCLDHISTISLVVGTHNEASAAYTAALMEEYELEKNDKRVYFAQLYGMSDNISFTLASLGFNVTKYVPYGPVDKVMPYLARRADENTSIAGQTSREFNLILKELKRRKTEK